MHVQQNWMQCSISAKVWKKSINTNKYLKLPERTKESTTHIIPHVMQDISYSTGIRCTTLFGFTKLYSFSSI